MFQMARERGSTSTIDPRRCSPRSSQSKTFRSLRGPDCAFDDAVQAVTLNDPTPDDSYLLMAAHAAGLAPNLATAVYARRLVQWQRDGHWVTSDFRPPHSSSIFTATATAVRAIRYYMPEELQAERDACILRARQWPGPGAKPASTEDAAFRLMGLAWAGASTSEIDTARRDLLTMRNSSGAWSELAGYPAEAYSTGESLFALHEAGVPLTGSGGFERFLVSTQAGDGTWRVHTRMLSPAEVSPPYFTTGFPYEKDEYLSYAGSVWATSALLGALPEIPRPRIPSNAYASTAPEWARTVLFGTHEELTALLDAGLDPNSKTGNGTTILMMAALDAGKVKILLARGANPKARAASGYDALTIATASRDTSPVLKALLDSGADVKAPEGVHAKNSPLRVRFHDRRSWRT